MTARSPRKKLSITQIVCIVLLWVILVIILLSTPGLLNLQSILAIVASGIIILVPVYKQIRRRND